MAAVLSMFSTSFCAVPDFIRVEPAMGSGPTGTPITTRASRHRGVGSGFVVTSTVAAPRRLQNTAHVGCRTAGGESHHDVPRAYPCASGIATSRGHGVLHSLQSAVKRPPAASEQGLYGGARNAKRRRALGSIQHSKAAAGARPCVNQTSAARQRIHDEVHGLRNGRYGFRDSSRNAPIFAVQNPQNASSVFPVQAPGARVCSFGVGNACHGAGIIVGCLPGTPPTEPERSEGPAKTCPTVPVLRWNLRQGKHSPAQG